MAKNERTFYSGEILFREGDPGGDLFIIKSGEVKVYQERSGQEVQLAQLGKGEILGAMTATSRTPRTASVKALTEVRVTIIENKDVEKLLKDMPPWAKILLKDLIFRLKFANELYIQSLSLDRETKDQYELLRSAIRVAKGILANAKVQQKKIEGNVVVDLQSSFQPLLDIFLGDKNTFMRIYNLFIESSLIELVRLRVPGKFLSRGELAGLQIFYEMANAHLAFAYQSKKTEMLAIGERKQLFELALWAKQQLPNDGVDAIAFMVTQVEDRLVNQGLKRANAFPLIQRATNFGLLSYDKDKGQVLLKPDRMRQTVAAMNVILALEQNQLEAQQSGQAAS